MGVKGIFRTNLVTLIVLIFLNLAIFSLGTTAWTVLGLLILACAIYISFRTGMGIGHEACAIGNTVDAANKNGTQLDKSLLKQQWSRSNGIKSIFASALIPYALGCLYIICAIAGLEKLVLPTRIAAWVFALPFWPIVASWHEDFVALTPDIVAILMVTPFILPLATFMGYLRGPKLWENTEKAMADGRRRAKAKSRIVRKRKPPKQQRPEI